MLETAGSTRTSTLTVTNAANVGSLGVTTSANIGTDLVAGTLDVTGSAGVGGFLNLSVTPSSLIMIDPEGYVTNVTLGAGLSLGGTTLSATGGAGSSNYTTLASGSLTVGTIIASNLVRVGQLDVLTNLNAATVTVTNSLTSPLVISGQLDVRTNLNAATVVVTNTVTVPLANVGQIDVRTNAYVSALRVTNGLTHSSWMSGAGNYTNTGNIRSSGGTVSSFNGSDYIALDAGVSALRTSFDPLTIAWQDTAIADLRTNMSLIYSNLGIKGTNFVGTLALPNVATNKILMTGGGSNVVAATVGPGLTFNSGVLAADGVLTNLVGTVSKNVTNENSTALQIDSGTLTLSPGVLSNLVQTTIDFPAANIVSNLNAAKFQLHRNSTITMSNLVWSLNTNTHEVIGQTNLVLTNIVGAADSVVVESKIYIRPSGPNMTLAYPAFASPTNGYYWRTNANSPMWTTATNGKNYVIAMTAIGTNLFSTITEWP
jgi:hypothetical protein